MDHYYCTSSGAVLMAEDRYIPEHKPFHVEADGFRVWETTTGFLVCNNNNGQTYRGDLKGVVKFIERERRSR